MSARVLDCYAPLAELVPSLLAAIQHRLDELAPSLWRVELNETSRSPEDQLAAIARGASHAPPGKAPHCVRKQDGTPAAMAADFWILDRATGALAPDGALVWAVIPCVALEVAPGKLASGAFFRTIPGGDWPHLEWRGWLALVDDQGVLK
jgi:hypothetical protein